MGLKDSIIEKVSIHQIKKAEEKGTAVSIAGNVTEFIEKTAKDLGGFMDSDKIAQHIVSLIILPFARGLMKHDSKTYVQILEEEQHKLFKKEEKIES